MKGKTLAVLLIVLAVLIGVVVVVFMQHAPQKGKRELGSLLMKGFPTNDVVSIVILDAGGGVELEQVAGRWVVKDRYGYPADFSKLAAFMRDLMDARIGRSFDASKGVVERLHLEDPGSRDTREGKRGTAITFKDAKGKNLARLVIGKTMNGGRGGIFPQGRYVMLGNRKRIYLIDKQFEDLGKTPSEWLDKDLIDVKKADIREITCMGPDGKNIRYAFRRPEKGKDLEPLHLPVGRKLKRSALSSLADVISSLRIEDVLSPGVDMGRIGMDHSAKVEYRLFDGMVYDLYPGRKCKDADSCYLRVVVRYERPAPLRKALGKASGKGEKEKKTKNAGESMQQKAEALNKELSRWVYKIPQWKHDDLVTDLTSLLVKESKKKQK